MIVSRAILIMAFMISTTRSAFTQPTAAPLGRVVDHQGREIAEADWPPIVKARLGQIRNNVFRMGEPFIHGSVVLARGVPSGETTVTMQLVGSAWVGGALVWPKGDPGDHVIGLCLVEKGGPFHLEVSAANHLPSRRELPEVVGALIWMGDVPLSLADQDGSSPLSGTVESVEALPVTTTAP